MGFFEARNVLALYIKKNSNKRSNYFKIECFLDASLKFFISLSFSTFSLFLIILLSRININEK